MKIKTKKTDIPLLQLRPEDKYQVLDDIRGLLALSNKEIASVFMLLEKAQYSTLQFLINENEIELKSIRHCNESKSCVRIAVTVHFEEFTQTVELNFPEGFQPSFSVESSKKTISEEVEFNEPRKK